MTYAKGTSVAVAKSRSELEAIVTKYGASAFGSYMQGERAMVVFECRSRRVIFLLELPARDRFKTRKVRERTQSCSPEMQSELWEQACREKWRSLVLVVKAKLEAVAAGVTTFEDEFAFHFAMPDGTLLRDKVLPHLDAVLAGAPMPPLLPCSAERRVEG